MKKVYRQKHNNFNNDFATKNDIIKKKNNKKDKLAAVGMVALTTGLYYLMFYIAGGY